MVGLQPPTNHKFSDQPKDDHHDAGPRLPCGGATATGCLHRTSQPFARSSASTGTFKARPLLRWLEERWFSLMLQPPLGAARWCMASGPGVPGAASAWLLWAIPIALVVVLSRTWLVNSATHSPFGYPQLRSPDLSGQSAGGSHPSLR